MTRVLARPRPGGRLERATLEALAADPTLKYEPEVVLGSLARRLPQVLQAGPWAILHRVLIDPPRSVAALAEREGYSRRGLCEAFRRAALPSPARWVRLARLLPAVRALQVEHCTVAEAARRCGWTDPFTLSQSLARATGLRPSVARRLGLGPVLEGWLQRSIRRPART